jgi:homogentisate 1,2-dioxygenase
MSRVSLTRMLATASDNLSLNQTAGAILDRLSMQRCGHGPSFVPVPLSGRLVGMANDTYSYQSGFGNEFATQALSGALPDGQNSPQKAPYGLYPELLSGTAFTTPRAATRRVWFYRIRPSVRHSRFEPCAVPHWETAPTARVVVTPEQLRWSPLPTPGASVDFIDGIRTMACNGDSNARSGIGVLLYAATASAPTRFLCNADGEMLIVPQQGRVLLHTEAGTLEAGPGEIAVIPRGYKFSVTLQGDVARGYICENYGALFDLPELGPIGSNALANPRDFLYPVALYDDRAASAELVFKTMGKFFTCALSHSPLDVVAWHGNYAPYKYDLRRFNTIGSISYDHPDPSIFTVLTSQTNTPGVANADFVIFPPRWLVAENTFRPPWFHRNVMSEFMGLIYGEYDAKPDGFVPGGSSLHNSMVAHGPSAEAFDKATQSDLAPHKLDDTMAFMFESCHNIVPTEFALTLPQLHKNYADCWDGLVSRFTPDQP